MENRQDFHSEVRQVIINDSSIGEVLQDQAAILQDNADGLGNIQETAPWIRFKFGDGSGFGLAIRDIEGNKVIVDQEYMGFTYDDEEKVVTTTHFPADIPIYGQLEADISFPMFQMNEEYK